MVGDEGGDERIEGEGGVLGGEIVGVGFGLVGGVMLGWWVGGGGGGGGVSRGSGGRVRGSGGG